MKKAAFLMMILCLLCSFAFAESAEEPGFLRIENGMLQPVLSWTDLRDEDYTNEGSDILRFCVWVETDYDTDLDGKADIVREKLLDIFRFFLAEQFFHELLVFH